MAVFVSRLGYVSAFVVFELFKVPGTDPCPFAAVLAKPGVQNPHVLNGVGALLAPNIEVLRVIVLTIWRQPGAGVSLDDAELFVLVVWMNQRDHVGVDLEHRYTPNIDLGEDNGQHHAEPESGDQNVSAGVLCQWQVASSFFGRVAHQQHALDPFEKHLFARWMNFCRSPKTVWLELRAQGFSGSLKSVERWVRR